VANTPPPSGIPPVGGYPYPYPGYPPPPPGPVAPGIPPAAPPPAAPAAPREVNPAPAGRSTAVFVLREVVALLFVAVWLLVFALELALGTFEVPFWFHCVGIGVLAYALGINVGELSLYKVFTAGAAGNTTSRG
jgi:hypothetical protein